jgi:hypothetical protein
MADARDGACPCAVPRYAPLDAPRDALRDAPRVGGGPRDAPREGGGPREGGPRDAPRDGAGPRDAPRGDPPWRDDVDPRSAYLYLDRIGAGATSTVWRAIERATGALVALKVIPLATDAERALVRAELLHLAAAADSPLVLKARGALLWRDAAGGQALTLVSTLFDASLRELVESGPLAEAAALEAAVILLRALAHLHGVGIVHRDVKSANVLLTVGGDVVLGDLGVASALSSDRSRRATCCGTPVYMSPQLIKGEGYGREVDVWAAGVTLIELLDGETPHAAEHPLRALLLITSSAPPTSARASAPMRALLASMLTLDAAARPAVAALLAHPALAAAAAAVDAAGGAAPALGDALAAALPAILRRRAEAAAEAPAGAPLLAAAPPAAPPPPPPPPRAAAATIILGAAAAYDAAAAAAADEPLADHKPLPLPWESAPPPRRFATLRELDAAYAADAARLAAAHAAARADFARGE